MRGWVAGAALTTVVTVSSTLLAKPGEAEPGRSAYEAEAIAVSPFSAVALSDAAFAAIASLDARFQQVFASRLAFSATASERARAQRPIVDPSVEARRRGSRSRAEASARSAQGAQGSRKGPDLASGFEEDYGTGAGLRASRGRSARPAKSDPLLDGFDDGPQDALAAGFDDFSSSDLGSGAGDASAELGPLPISSDSSFYDLSGSFTFGAAYNYAQDAPERGEADYRGLSRARFGADLQLDLELPLGLSARIAGRGFRDVSYAIKDKDEFTHEVLQLYESELEFKELYLQGSLSDSVDFQVGRQIIAWGSSETLRVLDVLSPLDNREPGLVDLRDLRLPVAATRIAYFTGPLRLTGIAIHESRFDEMPPFGSDFFPFDQRLPGEIRPANGGNDTEYAVALTGRFSKFDATLNWAQYFDDEPHLGRDSGLLEHSRLNLIGASADVPLGNFLVRGEVARIRGLEFAGSRRKLSRSDALLGIEYSGLSDKMVTLELVARKLNGFDDEIKRFPDAVRKNTFEGSLRYTANYLNDRARLQALFIVFGQQAQDGTTLRLTFDYDIRDAFTVGAGLLLFEEGDLPPFNAIDKNDRVFINVRYSF